MVYVSFSFTSSVYSVSALTLMKLTPGWHQGGKKKDDWGKCDSDSLLDVTECDRMWQNVTKCDSGGLIDVGFAKLKHI